MFRKLLLVCLIQAIFARRTMSFSPGRQVYVRNLSSEDYESRTRDTLHMNAGVIRGGPYIDEGSEKSDRFHTGTHVDHNSDSRIVSHIDSGHRAYYEVQPNNDGTEPRNDNSRPQNQNHNLRRNFRDSQNKDRVINNSQIGKETQHSLVEDNSAIARDHKLVNGHGQSELKTNLDGKTNISNMNTSLGIQYEGRNIESDQKTQGTNVEQGDNSRKNSVSTDQSFLNSGGGFPNKTRNDRLSEVHINNDMIIFKDEDNTGPNEYKTTTDFVIKHNKKTDGAESIGNEKDRENFLTTTSLPDDGLGDRTALDGDKCPDNRVKVRGVCMTPD